MKARFLRERALNELKASIGQSLEQYRVGNFDHLLLDASCSFETDIDLVETELKSIRLPADGEQFDAENCAVLLRVLPAVTAFQAADERLWALLSHTLMLEYARARWPIPANSKEALEHIRTHFFASNQRQIERDNVASRLWWMGFLCARVEKMQLDKSLAVLLYRSDVRANIIERPTTAQSIPVFSAIVAKLAKSYGGKKRLFERGIFRRLMISLNGLGGHKLLDALDQSTIESFIDSIISKELKLSEI